jgi:hypothetical protein
MKAAPLQRGMSPLTSVALTSVLCPLFSDLWFPVPGLVEENVMLTVRKQVVAIYVDRSSGQWIVRDVEGNLWMLPNTENPWDDRQVFVLTEETKLEFVPSHYAYMLRLPT